MARTAKQNAEEYRRMAEEATKGWPFAVLVAASVQPASGRPAKTVAAATVSKMTIVDFVAIAGCAKDHVRYYLQTWKRMADQGVVPPAKDLTPAYVDDFEEPDVEFGEEVAKTRERRNTISDVSKVRRVTPEALANHMTPHDRRDLRTKLEEAEVAARAKGINPYAKVNHPEPTGVNMMAERGLHLLRAREIMDAAVGEIQVALQMLGAHQPFSLEEEESEWVSAWATELGSASTELIGMIAPAKGKANR